MTLSKNDHIDVGVGDVYAAPFLGRAFLYRLFDFNCTLLIFHSPTTTVSDVRTSGRVLAVSGYAGLGPNQLKVHVGRTSAFIELNDLLAVQAFEVALPKEGATRKTFDGITITVEKFALSFTEKLIMSCPRLPQRELTISDSVYQVTGSVDVSLWPATVAYGSLKRECWKLSLYDATHNKSYGLESDSDWSLTALDIEGEGGFQSANGVTLRKSAST